MHSARAWYTPRILVVLLFVLTGCGGGGGGGSSGTGATLLTVGGTITGYTGSGLALKNGAETLAVASGATSFSFSGITNGSSYAVTVSTHPAAPAQVCSVINASGTVSNSNVTNVQVNCVTRSYTISGSVTGLSGTGLVLANNGTDTLPISTSNFSFAVPVADGNGYSVTILAQPVGQTCTVNGGSGAVASANVNSVSVSCVTNTPPPATFTVGGSFSGLSGAGLVLQNNGGDNLSLNPQSALRTFTFNTALANGAPYSVTVLSQPVGQTCTVSSGSGTVPGASVTNVSVSCVNNYTVGGSVAGLSGTGLVLQNNGGDNRSIATNGTFSFATALATNTNYNVTVLSQPGGQACAITNGSGTVSGADVSTVTVNCTTNTYSISGTVSGLAGTGLLLQNNGGNNLAISASGAFTFSSKIASGNTYSVTVLAQPAGQTCTVTSGSGTVSAANITNVAIGCVNNPTYTVGGSVTGLAGTGLVLQNNGTDNRSIGADGAFAFATSIASGNPYDVTVLTQPTGQTCSVTGGSGTVSGTVSTVNVTCANNPTYTIGGSVSGLSGTGLVLQNNGGDNRSIAINGAFSFPTSVANSAAYTVTVLTQPAGQTCTVVNDSGTVSSANVTSVAVTCANNPTYTIGGVVSGVSATGLVLQNNGGDNRSIAANGAFSFATAIGDGAPYSVTILSQPVGQTCTVSNASGTVATANVADIGVACTTNTYPISGTVSGLSASGLILQNNGGDNRSITANGNFGFNTPVASGTAYSVTVLSQPVGQTCTVSNGSGIVAGANVTNVSVNCTLNSYTISGNVSGPLSGTPLPGMLVLRNNGADDLSISSYGLFTFTTPVVSGGLYNVSIAQQPASGWTCIASGASGSVAGANVNSVKVNCVENNTVEPTGAMATARHHHSSTLLTDGRVLVAGGWATSSAVPLGDAEIFHATESGGSNSFTATGSLLTARTNHTATLLANGKVLVTGGSGGTDNTATAELFDPAASAGTGAFAVTGSMVEARTDHRATLLLDGTVLVTGGYGGSGSPTNIAERFNPAANNGVGAFAAAGSMTTARQLHSATRLADGRVLIAGGNNGSIILSSAELYDPSNNTFSPTGSLSAARRSHTATLLENGMVLIAGGERVSSGEAISSAEIYDPATGTFFATGSMAQIRRGHAAALLENVPANRRVVITGGYYTQTNVGALTSSETFDPASGLFANTGAMGTNRADHAATFIPAPVNKVLITGGHTGSGVTNSAELFLP